MAGEGIEQLQQEVVDLQSKIDTLERTDKHPADVSRLKDELASKVRRINELRRTP
jgi:peptidoglycan hydrolase CwlO-like protein